MGSFGILHFSAFAFAYCRSMFSYEGMSFAGLAAFALTALPKQSKDYNQECFMDRLCFLYLWETPKK
jgi:hypothetical protein